MSMSSRREYVETMRTRYQKARSRKDRSANIDELVAVIQCHRKHGIRLLNTGYSQKPRKPSRRSGKYVEILPVISVVWEALDYCCAERLHPQLLAMADRLARHGVLQLTPSSAERNAIA